MYIVVVHKKKLISDIWAGTFQCPCCNTTSHFHLKKLKNRSYIFGFVPFISFTEKRYLVCDRCGASKELKGKEYKKIYNEQLEKLDNRQIPADVIGADYSPKELKMWLRYIKLILAFLLALAMVTLSTGMSHEVDDIGVMIMSLLVLLPIGTIPLYLALNNFILSKKKQKIYNEPINSNYVTQYISVNIGENGHTQSSYVSLPTAKHKLRSNQIVGIVLMLLFLLPVIAYVTGDREEKETPNKVNDDPAQVETLCNEHEYEQTSISEPTYEEIGVKVFVCEKCGDEQYEYIPVLNAVDVTVTDKITYEYYDESIEIPGNDEILKEAMAKRRIVAFDIHIKNISNTDIETVKGKLTVEIGEHMITMNCEFNEWQIVSGETVTYNAWGFEYNPSPTYSLFLNDLMNKEAVYNADFEDLKISFNVTETVFKDQ